MITQRLFENRNWRVETYMLATTGKIQSSNERLIYDNTISNHFQYKLSYIGYGRISVGWSLMFEL